MQLTMVLIKVADISNEARPIHVADPWLDKLLTVSGPTSRLEENRAYPLTLESDFLSFVIHIPSES